MHLRWIACCSLLVMIVSEANGCSLTESGSARLVGFNSSYVGFVQVCIEGHWATISYHKEREWTRKNSMVACRELGFHGTTRIISQTGIPPHVESSDPSVNSFSSSPPPDPTAHSPQVYYSVECSGLEKKLSDCTWSKNNNKKLAKNVMVLCREKPSAGEVAIVGIGGKDNEGVIVMQNPFKTYSWSSICPTAWDDMDADVACKQLGFKGGASTSYSTEQTGDARIIRNKHFSHFQCSGSEEQLTECRYLAEVPYESCSSEYAGVVCKTESNGSQSLTLTIIVLASMIVLTLLLIMILLLVLRLTVKNLLNKPRPPSTSARRQTRRTRQTRIVHTQLDPDMPYAQVMVNAPPSYGDTVMADRRIQQQNEPITEDEESNLILGDELSNTDV